jgi:hypothetical protein
MMMRSMVRGAIASLGFCLLLAPAALAGQASFTGAGGRTTHVNTAVQKTETGYNRQRTTTYPNGQTGSAESNFSRTGNGGYNRSKTYTGVNGNQTTVQGSGSYQPGSVSGDRTITYPSGQSRTGSYQFNR